MIYIDKDNLSSNVQILYAFTITHPTGTVLHSLFAKIRLFLLKYVIVMKINVAFFCFILCKKRDNPY